MQNAKVYCPNCGTVNDMSATFCRNCGQDLTQAKAEVQAAQQAEIAAHQEAIYQQASKLENSGKVREAATLYGQLGDFKDAQEKAIANRVLADAQEQQANEDRQQQVYDGAMTAFNQGNLQQAATAFLQLGDFKDAKDKLSLVQNALTQQEQAKRQQDYEQAYQATLTRADQARTAVDLRNALTDLSRFDNYQDANERRAQLEAKLPSLMAEDEVRQRAARKKRRLIISISTVVALLVVIGGGFFFYHAHSVNTLNTQVAAQRTSNAKSFDKLPNTTQQDLRDMVATYHGNVNDYTYTLKQKTPDYDIVAYQFVGPDETKDVLPTAGTRLYNQTALTHQ